MVKFNLCERSSGDIQQVTEARDSKYALSKGKVNIIMRCDVVPSKIINI